MEIVKIKIKDLSTNEEIMKMVNTQDFIKGIEIKSNRFDFEPEITAKVLKRGARLCEVPISYFGREFSEGKKITWVDGFHALWALIKFRFTD